MVSQLIKCLAAYKSKMEYHKKDFDVERPVQYKEIKREMAKLYVFGPVCLHIEIKTKLTPEEMRLWQTYFQEENEKLGIAM